MHKTYLLLGTNLGNRLNNLEKAAELLQLYCGKILESSSVYETEPWGIAEQPAYLNQVLLLQTELAPQQLLDKILDLEKEMGRVRFIKWDQRLIDIDILFYDEEVIGLEKLVIPHPHLHQRIFVLMPLNEIAADFEHPVLKQTVKELLSTCPDKLKGKKFEATEKDKT